MPRRKLLVTARPASQPLNGHVPLCRAVGGVVIALLIIGLSGCGWNRFRVVHAVGMPDTGCPHQAAASIHCRPGCNTPPYPGYTTWRPLVPHCAVPVMAAGHVETQTTPAYPLGPTVEEIPPGAVFDSIGGQSETVARPNDPVLLTDPTAENQPTPAPPVPTPHPSPANTPDDAEAAKPAAKPPKTDLWNKARGIIDSPPPTAAEESAPEEPLTLERPTGSPLVIESGTPPSATVKPLVVEPAATEPNRPR